MRGAEKIVVMVAVAIPLLVATLGWPWFVSWVTGPGAPPVTAPAPEAAATTAAVGRAAPPAARPTARPTVGAPPTVRPAATTLRPALAPTPEGDTLPSDPGLAVSSFYALVASHQFDSAVQLWSPRMRAAFPPEANLNQRFSQTQSIRVQRADVVSQDQSNATVAVDLLESDGRTGGERHFVGNWYLVRSDNGWVLDQPQLQPAP